MPEAEAKTAVRGYDVVHFAVHGVFRSDEPLLSYIQLAAGGTSDGQLTAAEMFGLPLDRARIVVLSGCETGRSEVTPANELLGIQRALLFAGAQSLIVSSWKIDTNATMLWMKTFYREARTKPPAEASREAIRELRKHPALAHPFYWAPFSLIGG
jgi:CHAT domain-containing protein